MSPILWQRIEGALVLAAAMALLQPHLETWSYLGLLGWFFAPDMAFFGYLFGPRLGAKMYNLCHLYGLGAVLYALGLLFDQNWPIVLGLLWLAHAGFDRALGYGLKLETAFNDTHMGKIGRKT